MNIRTIFEEVKKTNPNMSLDEILYEVYDKVKEYYNKPFDVLRNIILDESGIDELEYYTKDVNKKLKGLYI